MKISWSRQCLLLYSEIWFCSLALRMD